MDSLAVDADALYQETFRRFKELFATARGDVARIQLQAYIPSAMDDTPIGPVVTGAVLAMLDHERHTGGGTGPLAEAGAIVNVAPAQVLHALDGILIAQAEKTGPALLESDLVRGRMLSWATNDYRKFAQWQRALDRFVRVETRHQGARPTLDDPFLRDVKRQAVEQLRPVLARVQAWRRSLRSEPRSDEIVAHFDREIRDSGLPWLTDAHNHLRLLAFARYRPDFLVTLSAPRCFDEFASFVAGHDVEYTRKQFSAKA